MTENLQIVSLFSGVLVGGIDLAFERAGATTVLLCEIDKAARTVLARHWPNTPIHPDITELTADDLRDAGARPDCTIVVAGFPCQDLSIAGARRGMGEGTRSGLFWQIVRLLADFPARWVVLENVPGLLSSHGGRDMGAVIGALADLGYGYAWRVLDAQYAGVPQRRRRVVIVGHLGVPWTAPAEILFEPDSGGGDSAPVGGSREGASADAGRGVVGTLQAHHGRLDADSAGAGHLVVTPLAVRGREGGSQIELGEPGGPYNTLRAGDGGSSRQSLVAITTLGDRTHALTAEGHDASEDGTGRGTPIIAATLTAGTSRPGVSGPVSPALGAKSGGQGVTYQKVIRSGARDADGNLPPEVWEHRDVAATLNLNDLGSESRAVELVVQTEVRRLTPKECERLQGHPDDWTAGQSDSARYKQLGNGVAVPVFEWVAHRLVAQHALITQAGAA